MDDDRARDVARFFDRAACCTSRRRPAEGRLHSVSRILLDLLEPAGLFGRSVLDVGCGQGALGVAMSQQTSASVTGMDLSPESVAAARHAAEQAGVRARFVVANAATARMEQHDVVVLNTVVCCYFDVSGLLANTLPAARSLVALSLPHSRGPRGTLARLLLSAENSWRRLRGDPFRAFVHHENDILRTLDRHGFAPAAQRDYWIWHITVLERHP